MERHFRLLTPGEFRTDGKPIWSCGFRRCSSPAEFIFVRPVVEKGKILTVEGGACARCAESHAKRIGVELPKVSVSNG